MSNSIDAIQDEECRELDSGAISLLIKPGKKDLGGFSVHRSLPHPQRRLVGPWIFFDHAGPAKMAPGEGVDVRPHPHINLATVTYFFEGSFVHRDSLGNTVTIKPGDINLMVAGKGIVHSERTPGDMRKSGHTLHALQLWLALPDKDEETEPAFFHYDSDELPALDVAGVKVRVMMGSAFGVTSPVKTYAETLYFEAELKAGQSMILPDAEERALYVATGEVELDKVPVRAFSMAVLNQQVGLRLKAREDSRIALIGGESLGERHIYWNFVSSRKERIEQAKQDWREGKFPIIPDDNEEFIPLPD